MASIGSVDLATKYKGPLGVAEALLLGKLSSYEQRYVPEVVTKIDLEAARIRIEMRLIASGKLDLEKLEEGREKASIDKAELFDFYNDNWDKLINEIRELRGSHV